MFAVDILPCMCLAALCSSVGKGALVAGPAGAAFAGPTFLAEYAIHRVSLSRFVVFSLRMSLIDIAKVLKQAVTEIWVIIGRVAGKPKVVAFQQ